MKYHQVAFASILFLLGGILGAQGRAEQKTPTSLLPKLDADARAWVEATLSSLSLEERVGQLIVATTPTRFTNVTLPAYERLQDEIRRFHLGGVHAFRGSILAASFLLRRLQEDSRIPLLLSADLEGGAGLIFEGATRFPRAMAIAATYEPELASAVARQTAREARLIGVNLSFSPVADVNNNPDNPIINTRSFGERPEEVARMTAAFVRGLQSGGVLATAKHFPGHGDTDTDSHLELAVISATRERLELVELFPFRRAVEAGVGGIMTAHLAVPALDPSGRPATLSHPIVSELLRNELGFRGLIITDAMNMYAISRNYPEGEAAVLALEAGVDIILYPLSVPKTHAAILSAVHSGRLSRERLDQSVRRILEAKARLRLHEVGAAELAELDREVGSKKALELSEEVSLKGMTLVRNRQGHLPMKRTRRTEALVISVFDRQSAADARGEVVVRELRKRGVRVTATQVDSDSTQRELALISALARRVDWVILPVFVRLSAFQESLELGERQEQLLSSIAELPVPQVVIAFGSPYILSSIPELPTYVAAYDDFPTVEGAAVKLILGEAPFRGRLPISLPGSTHKAGEGIRGHR